MRTAFMLVLLLSPLVLSGCLRSATGDAQPQQALPSEPGDPLTPKGEPAGRQPPASSAAPSLASCLDSPLAREPGCAQCACRSADCFGPIARCDATCVQLIACVTRECRGTGGADRTECAVNFCGGLLSAAQSATEAGPCLQPCDEVCSQRFGDGDPQDDAGA